VHGGCSFNEAHLLELMKAYLQSLIRHAVTAAAGFGGLLAAKGLIDSGDISAVNEGTAQAIAGVGVVVTALVCRVGLTLLNRFLPGASSAKSGGTSGGKVLPLLMTLGTAAVAGFLPSCSSVSDFPVTGSIFYRDPNSGAKGGLSFTPGERPTAYVRVPVYDPETGEKRGEANLEIPVGKTVDATSGK
jgi:hypothetical protein